MSRIGKKPIILPPAVEAKIAADSVQVKGPKGSLTIGLAPSVMVSEQAEPKALLVQVKNEDDKKQRALWGLMRQLISNAVKGVQTPFEKSLEFVGVGFRVAQSAPGKLSMEVGFSHPVEFALPQGIEAKIDKQILTVSGVDKQLVGETAAQIRHLRPPEPYKGKGIRYTTETIKLKPGKAAVKSA